MCIYEKWLCKKNNHAFIYSFPKLETIQMCNRRMDKLFIIVSVQGMLIPGCLYDAVPCSNEKAQATGSYDDRQEAHGHGD